MITLITLLIEMYNNKDFDDIYVGTVVLDILLFSPIISVLGC